jgi:hypothetical protein
MTRMDNRSRRWSLVDVVLALSVVYSSVIAATFSGSKNPATAQPIPWIVATIFAVGAIVTVVALTPQGGRLRRAGCLISLSVFFFCAGCVIYPIMQSARAASEMTGCMSNLKQLTTGLSMYMSESNDRLPVAS